MIDRVGLRVRTEREVRIAVNRCEPELGISTVDGLLRDDHQAEEQEQRHRGARALQRFAGVLLDEPADSLGESWTAVAIAADAAALDGPAAGARRATPRRQRGRLPPQRDVGRRRRRRPPHALA